MRAVVLRPYKGVEEAFLSLSEMLIMHKYQDFYCLLKGESPYLWGKKFNDAMCTLDYHRELENPDSLNRICCLLRNGEGVNVVYSDSTEGFISLSMRDVIKITEKFHFEQINYHAVINTRCFLRAKAGRIIELKNGMEFKVSRRKWPLFKGIK